MNDEHDWRYYLNNLLTYHLSKPLNEEDKKRVEEWVENERKKIARYLLS
jgi:hypothetical protein